MAVTMSFYNHTRKLFANNEVNLSTLRVMLLDGHTQDPTDTAVVADLIDDDEVSGSGWDAGGEAIGSAAVTVTDTNEAKLDGNDVVVEATGGSIGPATGAVIIADDFAGTPVARPLLYIDFDGSQTAGEGTDFAIRWHADGIHTWENVA